MYSVIMIISIISCTSEASEWSLTVGEPLPEFSIKLNTGQYLYSDSTNNKWCLVAFFNVSCPDCQKSLPILNELFLKYGDDILFIPINRDEPYQDVENYWMAHGFTMPFGNDNNRTIYNQFCNKYIPRYYLAYNGIIKAVWNTDMQFSEEIVMNEIVHAGYSFPGSH